MQIVTLMSSYQTSTTCVTTIVFFVSGLREVHYEI